MAGAVDTSMQHWYRLGDDGVLYPTDLLTPPVWGHRGAWVIAAEADNEGNLIDASDNLLGRHEDIAETIFNDPERREHAAGLPVLFAIGYIARGNQNLQRATATRLEDPNYGLSGFGGLHMIQEGDKVTTVVSLADAAPVTSPHGNVVRFDEPAHILPDQEREAFTARDSAATVSRGDVAYTRVGDVEDGTSGLVIATDLLRERERDAARVLSWLRNGAWHRPTALVEGKARDAGGEIHVPPLDADYRMVMVHGLPGLVCVPVPPRTHIWSAKDAGRFFGTLRELAEQPGHVRIWLRSCYSATAGDDLGDWRPHSGAEPPPVDDPLRTLAFAQEFANVSRRKVIGDTKESGATTEGPTLRQGMRGERGEYVLFLPEPLGDELDRLAQDTGLYATHGDSARETMLVLIRALRQIYGAEVAQRDDYHDLLNKVVALEQAHARDVLSELTFQFRIDLWNHLANHVKWNGFSPDTPDTAPKAPGPIDPHTAALNWAWTKAKKDHPDPLHTWTPGLSALLDATGAPRRDLLPSALGDFPRPGRAKNVPMPPEVRNARAAWALADAELFLQSSPHEPTMAAWGRRVLHLDPKLSWDPAVHRVLLRNLIAKAYEQRHDPADFALLTALHIWQDRFRTTFPPLDPDTSKHLQDVQWDLSGGGIARYLGMDIGRYFQQHPSGDTAPTEQRPPWSTDIPDRPLVIRAARDSTMRIKVRLGATT
ncbi:hypothetical protein [Streptomyces sp. NPDC020681]|uniref:hypothetical protein n=1 Tax=Streptomyces sp. NPDC020681 TaxID=3365083 RepID=UPI0037988739